MTDLHPSAAALAAAEAAYTKGRTRLETLLRARDDLRHRLRGEIAHAIVTNPDATNTDLGRRFNVTEGTVRNVRRVVEAIINNPNDSDDDIATRFNDRPTAIVRDIRRGVTNPDSLLTGILPVPQTMTLSGPGGRE